MKPDLLSDMQHIVIIGNGVTGITAARQLRKRCDDRITVISSETRHFFSRCALMYIYMGHLTYEDTKPYEDGFWAKNRIRLVHDRVIRIDTDTRLLTLAGGDVIPYGNLVVATGSRTNTFGWPGQDLEGVQGLFTYQDLLSMARNTVGVRHAVVVGGGLIGIEMVEMLLAHGISVSYLIRGPGFWTKVLPEEEVRLVDRHIREHHVDLRLNTRLATIAGDGNGRVHAVTTGQGERIECGFVGLAAGVHPNIDVIKQSNILCNKGVLVSNRLETNVPGVYAGGDCAELSAPTLGRAAIEPLWYIGKMHGETIAANLMGDDRPFEPGVWFNSAKFFDIEYQTYGVLPPVTPADQESFYWEHASGKKALRVNYRKEGHAVTAFNFLGLRGRQDVCEQWILQSTPVEEVLTHLGAANFDPEFFPTHEPEIVAAFNARHPDAGILPATPKGLFTDFMQAFFKAKGHKVSCA